MEKQALLEVPLPEEPSAASTGASCSSEEIPLGILKTLFPELAKREKPTVVGGGGCVRAASLEDFMRGFFHEPITREGHIDMAALQEFRENPRKVAFDNHREVICYVVDPKEYRAMHGKKLLRK